MPSDPLLTIENVRKYFPAAEKRRFLRRSGGWLKAVDGVSFSIRKGLTYGLVGESGCGKTTLAKLILLLEEPTDGRILFQGEDIKEIPPPKKREYRRSVQAVFQDPYSSLNPRMRVEDIIGEPIQINTEMNKSEMREKVGDLLQKVGLRPASASLYPHEFSGGQRQRIAVARALAINPRLIILDEPVSALDVSVRAQIMNLLRDLQVEFGLTYLLISHDLAVVKHMSTETGVMYLGKLVELGRSKEIYARPLHPYTQALFSAAMPSEPGTYRLQAVLTGEVPSALNIPKGCRFHPRCPSVKPVCREVEPKLEEAGDDRQVACHLHEKDA